MNRLDRPHPYLEVSKAGERGPWHDVYCADMDSFTLLPDVYELGEGCDVYVFFSKQKHSIYRVSSGWNRWRSPQVGIVELSMFGHHRAGKVESVNWFVRTEKMENESPGLVNSKQPGWVPKETPIHEGMMVAVLMYEDSTIMKTDKLSTLDFRQKEGSTK